jgi:dihydropteroate synthase
MGILNVTPDSFSDGGVFFSPEAAIARGFAMAQEGASWIDVGGESTRPGAEPVALEEELRRVIPVVKGLASAGLKVSIDTSKVEVARAAIEVGAQLVNDVQGLRDDAMLRLVLEKKCQVCIMDMRGTPATMQGYTQSPDVTFDVLERLGATLRRAESKGIERSQVLVDPGIGFGKSASQNFELLRRIGEFRQLGCRLLVGLSRKSFLTAVLGETPPDERIQASLALVAVLSTTSHIDVFRVHDVWQTVETLGVTWALQHGVD